MHQRGDLTRDSQLIYLSQWLGEFSEVEKDDFLQQLLDLYAPGQLAIGHRLAPLKAEDKAATLFDCRIDLFKQWYASWESADREECLDRLKEADAEFMERFQKSKETPNEDKIIEEFWLRLDNGSAEHNGDAAVREQPAAGIHENGTAEVQENATATVQENGSATIQENGTAAVPWHEAPVIAENETENIQVNGDGEYKESGDASVLGVASESSHQDGIVPTVEVSSPMSETKEDEEGEDKSEASTENVASAPSDESVGKEGLEEKSHATDKTQTAIENES